MAWSVAGFKPFGVVLWIWHGALWHGQFELTGHKECSHSVLMESMAETEIERFPAGPAIPDRS
jgi:hypothetical protein